MCLTYKTWIYIMWYWYTILLCRGHYAHSWNSTENIQHMWHHSKYEYYQAKFKPNVTRLGWVFSCSSVISIEKHYWVKKLILFVSIQRAHQGQFTGKLLVSYFVVHLVCNLADTLACHQEAYV